MARSNSIIIGVSTDMRDAVRGFRDLGRATRRNLTTTQRWARGLRAASFVAASALVGMAVAAKKAIADASDLAESTTKNQDIFKKYYRNSMQWAEDAAEKHGLSTRAALDYLGAYGKAMTDVGESERAALRTATVLTKLTVGLGSFYNLPHEQVHTNIASALNGEAEAVRRYGIDVSDLALRQEALAMGIYSGAGSLNLQQKRLAATSIMMRNATTDTGNLVEAYNDFTNTSTGAANSNKILQASIENLSSKMGTFLLPVYERVLHRLVAFSEYLGNNTEKVAAAITGFAAFAAATYLVGSSMTIATAAAGAFRTAFAALNFVIKANPFVRVISIIAGLVAVFGIASAVTKDWTGNVQKLKTWFDKELAPAIKEIKPVIEEMAEVFAFVWLTYIGPLITRVVIPMIKNIFLAIGAIIALLKGDFTGAWTAVGKIIKNFTKAWISAFGLLAKVVMDAGEAVIRAIKTLADGMLAKFKEVLGGLGDWLVGLVTGAIPRILAAVRGSLGNGIKNILNAAVPGNPFMVPDIPTLEGDARNRSQPVTLNVTGQASVDRMMTEEAVAQALYRILRRSDARHGELWAA